MVKTSGQSSFCIFKRNKNFLLCLMACMFLVIGSIICNSPNSGDGDTGLRYPEHLIKKIGQHFNDLISPSKKDVRIACLLNTSPKYHATRAKAVMDTWGKRCDYIYFVSNKDGKEYPYLNLVYADKVPDDYNFSWGRFKVLYKFAYANLFDKVDWILKADDDAFIIVENLKKLLADRNTSEPAVYGRKVMNLGFTKEGYIEGGSAIVISKGAFKKLVEEGLSKDGKCYKGDDTNEDVTISKCFTDLRVPLFNVRDETGELFHSQTPDQMLRIPDDHFLRMSSLPIREGLDCCSINTISFHHLSPEWMYVIEMLVYKIRVSDLPQDLQNKTIHLIPELYHNTKTTSSKPRFIRIR